MSESTHEKSWWKTTLTKETVNSEAFQVRLHDLIRAVVVRKRFGERSDDIVQELFCRTLQNPQRLVGYTPAQFTRFLAWWILEELQKIREEAARTVMLDDAIINARANLKARAVEKAVRALSSAEDDVIAEKDRLIWLYTIQSYSRSEIRRELLKDGHEIIESSISRRRDRTRSQVAEFLGTLPLFMEV